MDNYLLQHLLSQSARVYPKNVAVACKGRSINYNELEGRSNQCAAYLQNSGLQKGDRVGIMLGKSIESIIALFGILKAGAIYVPIDPAAPANRIVPIIKNCDIRAIFVSNDGLKKIDAKNNDFFTLEIVIGIDNPEVKTNKVPWVESFWGKTLDNNGSFVQPEIVDADPAYILHTSGSTGVPKGVVISHRNALSFVSMAVDYFKIHSGDRLCNHAPLHFDLSVFDIFASVKTGATVILAHESLFTFPVKLAEFIDNERITVWNSVSSVLSMLADRGRMDRFKFDSLRLIHFSGDVLPARFLRTLKQHLPNADFYNIYGQTEANSSLCYHVTNVSNDDAWKIPVGKPFPGFEVFALTEENSPVASVNEEGELYVKSPTVALGYWNDQERSSEKFVPDPRNKLQNSLVYKTGDIVRLDQDKNYVFVGRADQMIKSKGYRIELGEIETVLGNCPYVQHAVAFAVHDELIGNRIKAAISLIEGATIEDKDVFSHCAKMLPGYMIPESIVRCDDMPLTATGKVDRRSVQKMYS